MLLVIIGIALGAGGGELFNRYARARVVATVKKLIAKLED
jgi:hypothetical protein